ncbi:hypothetical protein [Parabacteroides sp. Marseille-P3160]|nr:hypothetical protein [Parabacteroides sp. Marseille-P3160]
MVSSGKTGLPVDFLTVSHNARILSIRANAALIRNQQKSHAFFFLYMIEL